MAPELDIEGILAALVDADVEFLLIGGVAVGFHGYVRATNRRPGAQRTWPICDA